MAVIRQISPPPTQTVNCAHSFLSHWSPQLLGELHTFLWKLCFCPVINLACQCLWFCLGICGASFSHEAAKAVPPWWAGEGAERMLILFSCLLYAQTPTSLCTSHTREQETFSVFVVPSFLLFSEPC